MAKRISTKEIEALYSQFHTPPHVIGHCRAVTEVALSIAEALNEHGYHLDLELIRGAGLVHDVARTFDEHWNVGADALEALGYEDEAAIVREHMFYQFNPVDKLNETDMVCLGDRLVKEDHYVGVDERFQYIMDKAPKEKKIHDRLISKREEMRSLLKIVETIIGTSIDERLKDTQEKEER